MPVPGPKNPGYMETRCTKPIPAIDQIYLFARIPGYYLQEVPTYSFAL